MSCLFGLRVVWRCRSNGAFRGQSQAHQPVGPNAPGPQRLGSYGILALVPTSLNYLAHGLQALRAGRLLYLDGDHAGGPSDHHECDPRWIDDPLAFRPDRRAPEFRRALPTYVYFPFGGGPRSCFGDSFA